MAASRAWARSSLFLPFSDLGLIVTDEEHDVSYKQQDSAPRYHARDAAIYYASLFNAKVLLGSATPSVESYFNAQSQKYGLAILGERFGGVQLPAIDIIDTKRMYGPDKNKIIITPPLKEAIDQSLEQNKQVILFQNRRGYSPYQVCQVCGWIPHCRYCDVSLNFHKNTNKLHCHYCGTVYPPVHSCLACGSDKFAQRNFGTERIEEQLEEMFPNMRIARMDIDSVRGKTAHDHLIQQFEQGRLDILVGTQMVVKGLDFENVPRFTTAPPDGNAVPLKVAAAFTSTTPPGAFSSTAPSSMTNSVAPIVRELELVVEHAEILRFGPARFIRAPWSTISCEQPIVPACHARTELFPGAPNTRTAPVPRTSLLRVRCPGLSSAP